MKTTLFTLTFALVGALSFAQTDNVRMNVEMNTDMDGDGVNYGFDMNVDMNVTETHTTTTTTTVTTTTSGTDSNTGHNHGNDVYVMPGYSGPTGCSWPVDQGQFSSMKNSIGSKDWDDTRLAMAKQIIGSNCLTSAQVSDVVRLMEWEEAKLDIAKFAYGYTYDIGNYYLVNDAFEWEASIEELTDYTNSYRW